MRQRERERERKRERKREIVSKQVCERVRGKYSERPRKKIRKGVD